MDFSQAIPIAISVTSLGLSTVSLVVTYRQKNKQDKLATRKALTDTVAAIVSANIEMSKLIYAEGDKRKELVPLRRHVNTQRRYLANHGDLLVSEIPDLATEVDYSVLAGAFESSFNWDRAETLWHESVRASDHPGSRAMNRRGLAAFYYRLGRFQDGRNEFEASLGELIGDIDSARRLRAETYAMWSQWEADAGFIEEGRRRYEQALAEAHRMAGTVDRQDLLHQIQSGSGGSQIKLARPRSDGAQLSIRKSSKARKPTSRPNEPK
ncbi:hypothetical protein DPM33_32945 [Mesorhizobium hawassense]|uniref:Tetratricopeptide repeat protein n=1 Tax=Mesorhizobium hawassense TaxID=1209954 RepID=A0A330H7U1_9HYPH|nr:tetratricopeptide repeat protein [Mesorhizobium hawassense]RAZ83192.1 hypothetical protein DPM33_32945 [Mesorhizobium hawassense]